MHLMSRIESYAEKRITNVAMHSLEQLRTCNSDLQTLQPTDSRAEIRRHQAIGVIGNPARKLTGIFHDETATAAERAPQTKRRRHEVPALDPPCARASVAGRGARPGGEHRVAVGREAVLELREWSRMAEELTGKRVRLADRIGRQLLRYYPQALGLTDDIGADWVLALWAKAPTPADARRLPEKRIARVLSAHCITAADALVILQRPALTVASGTIEAARAHIKATTERLNLVNRQIKDVTHRLDALAEQLAGPEPLGREYPAIVQSWRRAWSEIIPFYAFPDEVRRILYTTNAIEALNAKLCRAVQARGHFPTDDAALKLMFLVLHRAEKAWIMPPREWTMAKAQLAILFGERFSKAQA